MSKKGKFNFKNIFNNVKEFEPLNDIDTRKLSEIFKSRIADLEAKLAELNKEPLNCSQLENGMSLCVIQKSKIAELETKLAKKEKEVENWQYMYRSVMQSCHNGIEEDKRLEKLLAEKDAEHELLIYQFEEETEKLRKQIKEESDARKRFVEEVKNLKHQLAEYEEIMKKHNIVGILKLDAYLTDYLNVNEETVSGKIIKQLKHQLEEKEKEIAELNDKLKWKSEKTDNFVIWLDNQIKQLKEGK